MFAARGLGVSLGFFLIAYIAGSLLVCAIWELFPRLFRGQPSRRMAALLFTLRLSPFALAVVFTLALGVPSYLLLEPRNSHEGLEASTLALGAGCLLLLANGVIQASLAHCRTKRAIALWLRGSSRLQVRSASLSQRVGMLVTLGTVPLTLGVLFTVGFTLPSFGLFDPRVSNEGICLVPLILAACCMLITSVGIARALLVTGNEPFIVSESAVLAGASDDDDAVPVFQTSPEAPTLTVAGIRAPKVLVSRDALAALSEAELQSALRHEIAHIDSGDNLKKLLLRFFSFPGMSRLERAWHDASEMAADDAAVSSLPQAFDLASALIKISRIALVQHAELTSGFLQSSPRLSLRVQHLFAWQERPAIEGESDACFVISPALVAVAFLIAFYHPMLIGLHRFMERFIV